MMKKETIVEFLELIEKIKEENMLVIVEGKRDKEALLNFGITNIITLSKSPIYLVIENTVEKIEKAGARKNKSVVLLTDLDFEGKKLYDKINSGLLERGIKINNKLREFLLRKTIIRQIENLKC